MQHKVQPGHGELGVWLTANANYTAGKGAVTQSTISIDQHIAETVGRQTRWPSMVVGATGGRRTISFDRQGEPVLADPYVPADYAEYIDTMFELIYLALRTDSTRVVSFATTESEGGGPLKSLPCGNWHGTGHNTNDEPPDRKPKEYAILSEYDAWWTARLAKFLERLRTTEGNHDLLRSTAVLYGSGMSWPATHRAHNLPLLLAGGEGLGFAQGRHLAFNGQQKVIPNDNREHLTSPKLGPDAVSMSDLLRTISEQMGVVAKGFGESRRVLTELLA